jgi:hypothetical protein
LERGEFNNITLRDLVITNIPYIMSSYTSK